jgi:hypothetical protein
MHDEAAPSSAPEDPLERLHALIDSCLPALAQSGKAPPTYVPPRPPITPEEASGFFDAIDHSPPVFVLQPTGHCVPVGIRAQYRRYELLYYKSRARNEIQLFREWLTHAAWIARLDLIYPRSNIVVDVDPFDIVVYADAGEPFLAVEAKKSRKELDNMLTDMSRFGDRPLLRDNESRPLSNAERKMVGLLSLRPKFFLAVAPGVECAYAVSYREDGPRPIASLHRIDGVPTQP